MRFTNKYKLHANLNISTRRLPKKRVNKFNRSKWLKVQTKILKSDKKYSFDPRYLPKSKIDSRWSSKLIREKKFPFWQRKKILANKKYRPAWLLKKTIYTNIILKKSAAKNISRIRKPHRSQLQLRKYMLSLFDNSIRFEMDKSLKMRKNILMHFLLRHYYRLDLLLWSLDCFSTSFESRQKITNRKILVNGKIGKSNQYLKKGDIISFSIAKGKKTIRNNFIINNKRYRTNGCYFPFLEMDYYSNNIVILKDLKELSSDDLRLMVEEPIQLYKLYR